MIIKQILTTKITRRRAIYTLVILAIYAAFTSVPLPYMDVRVLKNPVLELIGMTSGGGYTSFTFFALGLGPYVTASIIVQILSSGLQPTLTEWSKRGNVGRKKLRYLNRGLTLLFSIIQAPVMLVSYEQLQLLSHNPHLTLGKVLILTVLITAGAMTAMILGETLNQYGLGNGVSILIAGNIVSQVPHLIQKVAHLFNHAKSSMYGWLVIVTFVIGLLLIVTLALSEYRYPIQHSREATRSSKSGYLPIKINTSGMIPVIVAGPILTILPGWFAISNPMISIGFYGLIVFCVGLVYSIIQMDPNKVTKQLSQSGTYLVGINLEDTESFLTRLILKINIVGSLGLTILAIVPYLLGLQTYVSLISWLIVSGVVIETVKQIQGLNRKFHYEETL